MLYAFARMEYSEGEAFAERRGYIQSTGNDVELKFSCSISTAVRHACPKCKLYSVQHEIHVGDSSARRNDVKEDAAELPFSFGRCQQAVTKSKSAKTGMTHVFFRFEDFPDNSSSGKSQNRIVSKARDRFIS
jgi:hypothetical protein